MTFYHAKKLPERRLEMKKLILVLVVVSLMGCSKEKDVKIPTDQETKTVVADMTPVEYLTNYAQTLHFSNLKDFSDLDLLKEDIGKHSVFLIGEQHAVHLNFPIQTKLLQYLNQEAGVTYYLAELPYTYGVLFNEYLRTGNTEILDYVVKESIGTAGGIKEQYDFVVNIYEYNKQQPKDKQIQFIAIDSDINMNVGLTTLQRFFKDKNIPAELTDQLKQISTLIKPNIFFPEQATSEIRNYLDQLSKDLIARKNLYEKAFGSDYEEFAFIVKNMIQGTELIDANNRSNAEFNVIREGVFKENFSHLVKKLPTDAKFFGLWGREHIYLSELTALGYTEQIPHLGQILNEEIEETKGKVLSIATIYKNSRLYSPSLNSPQAADEDLTNINLLTPHAKDQEAMLFKLNNEDSPFHHQTFFVTDRKVKEGTTNYFQYIILIQNSKAASPF
jgi:erythromycin esterase-like protein